MNYTPEHTPVPGRPTFRILVAGMLDEKWSARTHGMSMSPQHLERAGHCTELFGRLKDEAALMGILSTFYNHGVRILRVERVDEQD